MSLPRRAHAQLDPGQRAYGIYQREQLVGEIYRDEVDPAHYTEHWILYPGYTYPSATNNLLTSIRPSGRTDNNLTDFFARVPWSRGSRYVEAVCDDGHALPR